MSSFSAVAVVRWNRISLFSGLLALAVMRHYGWELFEPGLRGMAAKGLGAACILVLMWTLYAAVRFPVLLPLFAWWTWEELQVLICSAAYVVQPWKVAQGQAICSALVGVDLGAFGVLAIAALIWIPVRSYR